MIGRALTEAMPRQAVESLELEVRALKERIDESRKSGADVVAIAGVEQWLAEVRDALRSLTPAESLAGFGEAVQGLSRKIDQIVATSQDPRALQQLEAAVTALRSVASTLPPTTRSRSSRTKCAGLPLRSSTLPMPECEKAPMRSRTLSSGLQGLSMRSRRAPGRDRQCRRSSRP